MQRKLALWTSGAAWLGVLLAASAWAQAPWDGWQGPPGGGIAGIRFGMDREAVEWAAHDADLQQIDSRRGTMRFSGKLLGRRMELMAEFVEDSLGERLYHIQVTWEQVSGSAGGAVRFFEQIDSRLTFRHGPPLASQDSSPGRLSTATGSYLRLYRDVELQAVLELKAVRPDRYNLTLLMDYPQLHPELAGR